MATNTKEQRNTWTKVLARIAEIDVLQGLFKRVSQYREGQPDTTPWSIVNIEILVDQLDVQVRDAQQNLLRFQVASVNGGDKMCRIAA
jgi:hypothetical protein